MTQVQVVNLTCNLCLLLVMWFYITKHVSHDQTDAQRPDILQTMFAACSEMLSARSSPNTYVGGGIRRGNSLGAQTNAGSFEGLPTD